MVVDGVKAEVVAALQKHRKRILIILLEPLHILTNLNPEVGGIPPLPNFATSAGRN